MMGTDIILPGCEGSGVAVWSVPAARVQFGLLSLSMNKLKPFVK
eukprot:CAMPEP_0180824910 /NCGR_PEP_ID=MMETSP1038_2-20121128/72686_1 /TAXON_ID=632150 /ORGANISM="Azadinium spinosum, Strain 3D9" /LENGTH=43 /DNA_ID= /DNA_START= /DNA_END= /DNA_ORIENTATION=